MSDRKTLPLDLSPESLAQTWLRAWDTGNLGLLRLSPDFVHTSPFGRIEGAEEYLRVVEPMSAKTVVGITIKDVVSGKGRAAIAYELETPKGTVEACDWVFVEDGVIREVRSYYDSVVNRSVLEDEP